jgi:hypothetical protein
MGSSAHSYRFSERERRIIGGYGGTSHHGDIKHGLADIAATMLRHLQYLEQAAQRARQAQLVGSISTRVRETLDMDLILQTALREIGENMGISSIEVQMQRRAAVAPSTVGDAPSTVGGAPSASTSMPKEAVQQPDPGRAEGPDETEQVR